MPVKPLLNDIDPLNPLHAYFVGFFAGDGSLRVEQSGHGQKGKAEIEIGAQDIDILLVFQSTFGGHVGTRTRNITAQGRSYVREMAHWRLNRINMVEQLNRLGIPVGKKDETVQTPMSTFSERDYWRGLIDADGSLGWTSGLRSLPYVSLITKSDLLAEAYKDFVASLTDYRPETAKNERDNAYNIVVLKEQAAALANVLYPGCLSLRRKAEKALEISAWVRPADMRVIDYRFAWTDEAREFVANNPIEVTMQRYDLGYNQVVNERKRMRAAGWIIPDGRTQTRLARTEEL
jgi:predicted Zn-dependent protease